MTEDTQTDIELIGTPESNDWGFTRKAFPTLIQGIKINGLEVAAEKIRVHSKDSDGMPYVAVTVTLIPDTLKFVMPDGSSLEAESE